MNKPYNMHRIVGLLIAMTSIFFVTGCGGVLSPLPYRSLAPFKGKVIDADTKEPIEGAVVLAVYYFTSYGIAGSNSYVEDGQETLTDKNGEFELPRTRRWFVLHRGYPRGKLVIFKPGYGLFPKHRCSEAVGENKSWPPPEKYIVYELPKLKTTKERELNLPGAFSYEEVPYKHQKMYIMAINKEAMEIGISPYPVPTKEHEK